MSAGRALVTGVLGQDGTYLARALAARGYDVVGTSRDPTRVPDGGMTYDVLPLDLRDGAAVEQVLRDTGPDVIFNLAGRSSGQGMFDDPVAITDINGVGVTRLLEAMRAHRPSARLCHASSSEIFGLPQTSPQSEVTAPAPRSPYGPAKLYADTMIRVYRRTFGLFACSAILFNHESPLRRQEFVTRKVSSAAAAIKLGLQESLVLGDLDARRDWGFAGDYVQGMVLMLEQSEPRDFVFATGRTRSVRELCEAAFDHVGLDYRVHVRSDATVMRAPEQVPLVGDPSRAHADLGWQHTISFGDLVRMMVDADLERLRNSTRL